ATGAPPPTRTSPTPPTATATTRRNGSGRTCPTPTPNATTRCRKTTSACRRTVRPADRAAASMSPLPGRVSARRLLRGPGRGFGLFRTHPLHLLEEGCGPVAVAIGRQEGQQFLVRPGGHRQVVAADAVEGEPHHRALAPGL